MCGEVAEVAEAQFYQNGCATQQGLHLAEKAQSNTLLRMTSAASVTVVEKKLQARASGDLLRPYMDEDLANVQSDFSVESAQDG